MRHELKTDSIQFQHVWSGLKSFEIRLDDRNFDVKDTLLLKETTYTGKQMLNGMPLYYTGREILVSVIHIMRGPVYGLADGWCIMSIKHTSETM